MKIKLIFIIFITLNCLHGFAQQESGNPEKLTKKYSKYFNLKSESIFLHLNKTVVAPDEDLWFSAYTYFTELYEPSLVTTNLNVNLYNAEGELLEAKTFFVQDGQASGYFELEPTKYPPGTYLIKASTHYMKNFREDLSFSQCFTILGESNEATVERKYDLQLLPEGGHLVADVENSVGVKLIDNLGRGVFFFDGEVLNSKGEVINIFKSNQFGLAKFSFTPLAKETYTVVLTPEYGDEIHKEVPKPEKNGLTLTAQKVSHGVLFSIKTNKSTFKTLESNSFYLALHKDGYMKLFEFDIPKESLKASIKINNPVLYRGVNIITVFNQNLEPLLERMVFSRTGIRREQVEAHFERRELDSLIIALNAADAAIKKNSLSISVLPAATKAYKPRNNILSAFYIEPYIKGNLEDGGYYFSEENTLRRRNYDLDLLLMTQGWSKYSWHNIFNNSPMEYYKHQAGFTIKGRVNSLKKIEGEKLAIKSPDANIFEVVDLNSNGTFELTNMVFRDSTALAIGLIDGKKGKVSYPSLSVNILPERNIESIEVPESFGVQLKEASEEKNIDNPENFISDAISLETVYLETSIVKEEEGRSRYLLENSRAEKTIIDDRMEDAFYYITDYIGFKGYKVFRGQNSLIITSRRANINMVSPPPSPVIYIDGHRINDYDRLIGLTTAEVASIVVNKSGASYGFGGAGGVIKIETKKGNNNPNESDKRIVPKIFTSNGFSANKEFYTPQYKSYSNNFFDFYGAIGWFPSVHLKEGSANIKILNTLQTEVKLFVEGMTEEGALISEVISVKVK